MTSQQKTVGTTTSYEVPVQHNARLTVAEIAQLWATYMQYTLLTCTFAYYHHSAQDPMIKELMMDALERSQTRANFAYNAFKKENIPIPMGFTEQDVNLNAPPLFYEIYLVHYLRNMIKISLTLNSLNLNMSTRQDIRDFYTATLDSTQRLNTKITDFMLSEGILPRPPYVTISHKVEHVHKPDFLTGFFGEKRPLLTIEIAHLYHNALTNEVGRTLLMAFRQVSPNPEVRDYFSRGMKICDSIIEVLSHLAQKENIFFNFTRDADVTESTEAPFSDRLMMFHIYLLNTIGAGMYGVSGAVSARHDIMKTYGQFLVEVGIYAETGVKLMMKNDWLEEPPQILDREEIAKLKH